MVALNKDFLAGKERQKGVETAAPGDPHSLDVETAAPSDAHSFKCPKVGILRYADFLFDLHRPTGVNTQAPTGLV